MAELSQYQQLELIRVITGHKIHLGPYESVRACSITDTQVVLVMNRVKVREGRRKDTILAEGLVMYSWTKSGEHWKPGEPIETWHKPTHSAVLHYGPTADEQIESHRWATLCWRPGTARYPLDGDEIRSQPLLNGWSDE